MSFDIHLLGCNAVQLGKLVNNNVSEEPDISSSTAEYMLSATHTVRPHIKHWLIQKALLTCN